jgi:hypothetical protein
MSTLKRLSNLAFSQHRPDSGNGATCGLYFTGILYLERGLPEPEIHHPPLQVFKLFDELVVA